MPEFNEIIDSLAEESDNLINELLKTTSKASDELLEEITDFIGSLKRNPNGTIRQSVENLKAINNFRPKLISFFENTAYADASKEFVASFKSLTDLMDEYFSSMSVEIGNNSKLYKEIINTNILSTSESLIGAGLEANITENLIDILKDGVVSGSDKLAIKEALKEYLITKEKLTKYAEQISTDAITQYTSNYINTISADLGLEHYYYKGTKITDTRPFCNKLAGKYFTETQLKSIISSESSGKGWQGMIPGTNWTNFKIYRGGYRCRHYVLPVSKAIYDNFPNSHFK